MGFVSGLGGLGKIRVPDLMPGSGLIFFLLLLFSLSRIIRLSLLISWLNHILLMLSFERPGCLFSAGLVILLLLLINSWILLVISCLRSLFLDLPRIAGRDLQEVASAEKSTAGGLDGRAWNEPEALP